SCEGRWTRGSSPRVTTRVSSSASTPARAFALRRAAPRTSRLPPRRGSSPRRYGGGRRGGGRGRRAGAYPPEPRPRSSSRPPLAARIGEAEIVLRLRVALFGGALIPARGLGEILRHAAAFPVHHPELEAGDGVALIGGALEPGGRLGVALRDAAAAVIGGADDRLGARIAVLGERPRELERLGVIALLER